MNTAISLAALENVVVRFGDRIVPTSRLVAWEDRRVRAQLRRLGVTPAVDRPDAHRRALLDAKLDRGRAWAEGRHARAVAATDRLVGALARASSRRRTCRVEIAVPGASADAFVAWYRERALAGDDAAMLAASPDHHLFRPTADGRQEAWETTGGSPAPSRFFFSEDDDVGLVTPRDPSFPVALSGTARLGDGTVVGGIRHQFRDESGGVRAALVVELPWALGAPAALLHRPHLACEFARWLRMSAAPDA